MKKQQLFILVLIAGFMIAGPVLAQMEDPASGSAETALAEVGNKTCPVSGEKVGEMGKVVQIEYNGKLYNLCCAMCKRDFMSDPAKYSAIAEQEAANNANP